MAGVVQGEGVVAVIDVDIHDRQVNAVALAGQPAQFTSHRGFVLAVGVVLAQVVVLYEAIAVKAVDRQAVEQLFAHQRAGGRRAGIPAVVFGGARLHAQAGLCLRLT